MTRKDYFRQEVVPRDLQWGVVLAVQLLLFLPHCLCDGEQAYAYFSQETGSQIVLPQTVWSVQNAGHQTGFSFRTCSNGELLFQQGTGGDYLKLSLINDSLEFSWSIGVNNSTVLIGSDLNSNKWYTVSNYVYLGALHLEVRGSRRSFSEIIYNATTRTYFRDLNLQGSAGLRVGQGYTGCMLEGPNVIFVNNVGTIQSTNVTWSNSSCPESETSCSGTDDINNCYSNPCLNGGTCVDGLNNYTCTCQHLFNGTICENNLSLFGCAVEPCLNNGTCTTVSSPASNYHCECIDGYNGVNCESNIYECGSDPCLNGGTCIDRIGRYDCSCNGTGFYGDQCQTDVNECDILSSPCGSGGTCFNTPGNYTCVCPIGFFGHGCSETDECSSNPCSNGGTCQDGFNSFICTCAAGYTGATCQTDIDDCVNQTCPEPHSRCKDLVNNYTCVCEDGFSGTPGNCQDIDECNSNPCVYSSACHNQVNNFTCDCLPGYTGKRCDVDIDDCEGNPCANNASCTDGVNSYSCSCLPGFTDRNCSTDIDECQLEAIPCRNGGTCRDQVNGYTCDCVLGYTGNQCDTDIDECDPSPCRNSIRCMQGIGFFVCTCLEGYNGTTCENNIDDCASRPCLNGGTCNDEVNGFNCSCQPEWMGELCQDQYDACSPVLDNCRNGANCSTTPPSHDFQCDCQLGYSGTHCEHDIDECASNPCTTPQVCFDGVNSYHCDCRSGFTGANCSDDIDECAAQPPPCQNWGVCTNEVGNYSCQCPQKRVSLDYSDTGLGTQTYLTGYTGRNCEISVNECELSPPICMNGGGCTDKSEESVFFSCSCPNDGQGTFYVGYHCEQVSSYCTFSSEIDDGDAACKNGGTCQVLSDNFTCICAPGWQGRRCGEDIDECLSSPCQYNGTCINGVNRYDCDCIDGITGVNCETNIDDCTPNPCGPGNCSDGINSFTCDCTDTGFKGHNCSENIDDCDPEPCVNGGICQDRTKDYFCQCNQGYQGKNCSEDIDECTAPFPDVQNPPPCDYNGTCLEKSDLVYYNNDAYPVFNNLTFSYAEAHGFLCVCIPGITGARCEINIDDCNHDNCKNGATCRDLISDYYCDCAPGYRGTYCGTDIDECAELDPCKNGGSCTEKVADYDCACLSQLGYEQPYSGKNCTFALTVCNVNECQNGATCLPFLVSEEIGSQDYDCLCKPGFVGDYCNISTTMSFDTQSYLLKDLSDSVSDTEISFRFRTTLPDALLMGWSAVDQTGFFMTLELHAGALSLGFHSNSGNGGLQAVSINKQFNNAHWHTVELNKTSLLTVRVKSDLCQSGTDCLQQVSYTATVGPQRSIYLGSHSSEILLANTISKTGFVGCMEDVTMESETLVLGAAGPLFHQLSQGCPRQEQCLPDPCNNRGQCQDLWNKFQCDCRRPYLGNTCDQAYEAATFAFNATDSSASFSLSPGQEQTLMDTIDLSLFFRTRKESGLIAFLGAITRETFVAVEVREGHMYIQYNLCGEKNTLVTRDSYYDNGAQHFIRFTRMDTTITFNVDDHLPITDTLSGSCLFYAENFMFGGQVPSSRRRRGTSTITTGTVGDFSSSSSFKGTLQDVRLNGFSVQFYPLTDPSLSTLPVIAATQSAGLQQGEVTDPLCDMLSPCDNNSTCSDVFFNDYSCDCLHGYRGKNCSELDFCVTGQCPLGSTCQSLMDGFECISEATLNGVTSYAKYSHNLSATAVVREFSLKFRTVVKNGWMFSIQNGNHFYKLRITGSNLELHYRISNGVTEILTPQHDVSDSKWYTAVVMETTDTMTLTLSDFDSVNLTETRTFSSSSVNLSAILQSENTEIMIGSDRTYNYRIPYYQGCLSEVRIGKVLLPFFNDDEFVNNTSVERFLLGNHRAMQNGCTGGAPCRYNQCQHSAPCEEDYYSYTCQCPVSYSGQWCQDLADHCGDAPCGAGQCVSVGGGFQCHCPSGYTGTRCEEDVNECSNATPPCLNNGSCDNSNGTFTCNCATGFTGEICEILLTENCSNNPCQNGQCADLTNVDPGTALFNCTCDPGYEGYLCDAEIDFCADTPCDNGGNCTSVTATQSFTCDCLAGFTGDNCQTNVDDCPSSTVCQNGGSCIDGVNDYSCNCTSGWTGADCRVDVDECNTTQPCQNGGFCANINGGYFCECRNTGYQGPNCENDVNECDTPNYCLNGGSCTNSIGSFDCNCTDGYEGSRCETANCSLVTCENNGTCQVLENPSRWQCNCPAYYEGERCSQRGPCVDAPCDVNNSGPCTQNIDDFTYQCPCNSGWEGQNCTQDINECDNSPCVNGTCLNNDGSFTCDCFTGFEGNLCEQEINECDPNPCQNAAACIDEIGNFTCNCTGTGYKNDVEITCTEDLNECVEVEPCLNGGNCINSVGDYSCECTEDYEGKDCEVTKEAMDDNLVWYIVGPVVGVVLILIIIGVVWALMCMRSKRATRGRYSPSRQEVTGSRVELPNVMKKPPLERLI